MAFNYFRKVMPIFVGLLALMLGGCCSRPTRPVPPAYEDGVYRGVFIDGDSIQINVEFQLDNGIVTSADFRHLRRDADYHLDTDREPYRSVIRQYREALEYLVGKKLEPHLADLYTPEKIITTDVEGYTQATLRSNKIVSAIRDALNRGVYSY